MKLPTRNIEKLSNEELKEVELKIQNEIERRILFLKPNKEPEYEISGKDKMEGLEALFG